NNPMPARIEVLPFFHGSQAIPNCGAKLRLGWLTRFPNPGANWLRTGIGGRSASERPVSRTYLNPAFTVRLGFTFQVSPTYQENRVSKSPPAGRPNDGISVLKPCPLPISTNCAG